jgi:hypothetical protein
MQRIMILLFVLGSNTVSAADDPTAALSVTDVRKYGAENATKPVPVGLGDRIVLSVNNLHDAVTSHKLDPQKLVLFLDGHEIKDVTGQPTSEGKLSFLLERSEASRDAWAALLGRPSHAVRENTPVSVGLANQGAVPSTARITLIVFHEGWLIGTAIFLALALGGFWYLALKSDIIRDSQPPEPPAPARRPYSLSRVQMAFWFFLVIGALLLIFLITGDWNALNNQALVLIGIGTGTALGAAIVEATKDQSADRDLTALEPELARLNAELANLQMEEARLNGIAAPTPAESVQLATTRADLAQKQALAIAKQAQVNAVKARRTKPTSDGFIKDILTDINGVSFHRFQMIIWTIILGAFFITNVYDNLAMPEFDATLLALTGISAGTYLGFKIPEKQS